VDKTVGTHKFLAQASEMWRHLILSVGWYQTFSVTCCLCVHSKSELVANIFVDTGTLKRKYEYVNPEISSVYGSSTLEHVINQSDRIKLVSATNKILWFFSSR